MRKKKTSVRPKCPAAQEAGGRMEDGTLTVICGVMAHAKKAADLSGRERDDDTGVVIRQHDDEASLQAFCCNKFHECPVWQEGDSLGEKRAQRRREMTEAADKDAEVRERYGISAA